MATNDDFPELDAPVDGDTPDGVPDILVGPVQRFRGAGGEATVFLELSAACEVELRVGGDDAVTTRARTWELRGHHYVLLMVSGLPDDRAVPYEVWLGDTLVWPDPARDHPPSVFAPPADHRLRLSFGSCRELGPYDEDGLDQWGADALVGLSRRLQSSDHGDFPHLLLHLGDQVYADEPSPDIADRLRELHRDIHDDAREEIRNFEEYTWLYHTTWMHPDVRWLLSTVPNAMILDDHDLRDDWNTSASWRRDVQTQPWWRDRVIGGLASYWVYQHIGNLSPAELHDDPVFAAVTTQPPTRRGTRSSSTRGGPTPSPTRRAGRSPATWAPRACWWSTRVARGCSTRPSSARWWTTWSGRGCASGRWRPPTPAMC